MPTARPLLAPATHLGIEGSGLLQLRPAQGLAEGVPQEASILMHHLPRLLKQLLFIRDAWQAKKRWQQVSEGRASPTSASRTGPEGEAKSLPAEQKHEAYFSLHVTEPE